MVYCFISGQAAAGAKVTLYDSLPVGKLIEKVICRNDSTVSYAAYIPVHNTRLLPVVYFFDPHGDGAGALRKYSSLAERYHFILVASNNSKNGNSWALEERNWQTIVTDTRCHIPADTQRIYTCGFSGGAKVAAYLALQQNGISAVISCGAILPEMLLDEELPFSFTAITGAGDLNRSDIVDANNVLDKKNIDHRILFFNGIHEWPPMQTIDQAFSGLQLDAMKRKLVIPDTAFINEFIRRNKTTTDSLLRVNDQLAAVAACAYAYKVLNGVATGADWFAGKESLLKAGKAWQLQQALAVKEQEEEQFIKSEYQHQFQQGSRDYWIKTIEEVMQKAKRPGPGAAMYQRLKAYLSLAFYSISNQCISGNQNKAAAHFLALYKLVDAGNSEAWYFSAVLDARTGNTVQAKADLLKALSIGFSDKTRLLGEEAFRQPALNSLLQDILIKIK